MERQAGWRLDSAQRLRALAETGLLDTAPEESFDRFTRLAKRLLGVSGALVSLVDDSRQFFKSAIGLPEPWASKRETPLSHSFCQHVVTSDAPFVVSDARHDERVVLSPGAPDLGIVAYAGMPVRAPDGSPLGALCAIDSAPRAWSDEDVAALRDLAAAVSGEIALRVTALRERGARRAAEHAGRRLEFLAEAATLLASSLDYEQTLSAVARLAVPTFADWCLVHLRHATGTLLRAALAGPDPQMEEQLRRRHTRQAGDFPHTNLGPARVAERGVAELVTEISDDMLRALARDEHQLAELRRLGIRSVVMAPLIAREQRIGVMTFVSTSPGRLYEEEDLRLLEDLARRCAAAIDNARLFQERDTVARVLQTTLLPPELPRVDALEIGAHYQPFGTGAEVGGDFYDVFELDSGRWILAIGDVCGKGPGAAALTGLARHSLRAAAVRQKSASGLLASLNEALLVGTEEQDDERFCTVACLRVQPLPSGAAISAACAGHPPPLRLDRDGRVTRLHCEGIALGLFTDVAIEDLAVEVGPGELIALFTDGVTEARNPETGELYGSARVEELLATCPELSAQQVADRLARAAIDWQSGAARDDVAVLVLRVPPAAGTQPGSGARSR